MSSYYVSGTDSLVRGKCSFFFLEQNRLQVPQLGEKVRRQCVGGKISRLKMRKMSYVTTYLLSKLGHFGKEKDVSILMLGLQG